MAKRNKEKQYKEAELMILFGLSRFDGNSSSSLLLLSDTDYRYFA